jgi:hypothetical protein
MLEAARLVAVMGQAFAAAEHEGKHPEPELVDEVVVQQPLPGFGGLHDAIN